MRATALFMPTIKEDPADAEAISHKLMVRGGFVRQFASGIYVFLPLGWRVMGRVFEILREEMDAIGAVELSMPTLHPAEVWRETGRYDAIGDEMFRLQDRGDRDMVLAMTHEEIFAWLAARELRSYRDLPQIWYQLQLKFRDEPRPKGGVLRVREFVMKDSYSFDIDADGLDKSYQKHIVAYDRICSRCGIEFYRVESDSGFMGGAQAHEYIAPSPAGEDRIAVCGSCGYAANVELARSVAVSPGIAAVAGETIPDKPSRVETPGQRSIEQVSTYLGVSASSVIKAMVYVADDDAVLALVRGDHTVHESKLSRHLQREVRPAGAEEVEELVGAEVGFVGPVGIVAGKKVRLIADETLRPSGSPRAYVVGGNEGQSHLVGVIVGRDFTPEFADLREAQEGDGCPECGRPLSVKQGIEVGNIFKLGSKYSEPLGATVLDEAGAARTIVMGSYGIGPARLAAAAVEQHSDARGIVWPKAIAPFDVNIVQVQSKDDAQSTVSAALHDRLQGDGWQVLWDDRDERPGFKFADADLIGCPVRVTVGKKAGEGMVEVQARREAEIQEVSVAECPALVRQIWEGAL
jgi:prolyl-tRNA synthetase